MKKIITIILTYIILFASSNLLGNENNKLKIGLLAPLSGEYSQLGNSLLYSLQLALEEIDDEKLFIIPRDSGFNDKNKIKAAIEDLRSQGVKIVIGPISNDDFENVKNYSNMIFLSPSNISPEFTNNIISIGISLESQLLSLIDFIKKQKKTKTMIMYPENQYSDLVEVNLKKLNLNNYKKFKYNPNPEVLTGEIETLTNYSQRKNLELRKKCLKIKKILSL